MCSPFSVIAANIPDSQELIQQLGIQQQDLANLNQGEIVYFDVAGGDENELAAGAAIYLQASPSKIIDFINKHKKPDIHRYRDHCTGRHPATGDAGYVQRFRFQSRE